MPLTRLDCTRLACVTLGSHMNLVWSQVLCQQLILMAGGNAYKVDTTYCEVNGVIQGHHYYKSVCSLHMHRIAGLADALHNQSGQT